MITAEEIKEWFDNDIWKGELSKAKELQLHNQVYTIPFRNDKEGNDQFKKILERCSDKIGNQRTFSTFKQNISYPLEVTKFVKDKVFKSLSKVWSGEGGYIERYPSDVDTEISPDEYFYKNNVWKRYITNPNDLLSITINENNEVDWHFVDIADVEYLGFEYSKGDYSITEIVYKEDKDTFVFATKEDWGKFEKEGDKISFIDGYPKSHNFGFNPCTFISNKMYNNFPVVRSNNITESLGQLEDLFFSCVSRNIIDKHMLPYTVINGQKGCSYDDGTVYCSEGFLKTRGSDGELELSLTDSNGGAKRCPQCGNSEIGYGGLIEVDATGLDADQIAKKADNAILFKHLDVDILKYPSERKEEIAHGIFNEVVGISEALNPRQQHNELHVLSTYESQLNVMFDTKKVFECFMSLVDTKVLKIANASYVKTVFDLGSDYYLQSEKDYQESIKFGNENRIEGYIDNKRGLIEVKYRNNKTKRDREVLILKLEKAIVHYPYLTNEQIVGTEKISEKELFVNQNFYSLIEQIEMEDKENRYIHEILQDQDYKDKLNFITKEINRIWEQKISN